MGNTIRNYKLQIVTTLQPHSRANRQYTKVTTKTKSTTTSTTTTTLVLLTPFALALQKRSDFSTFDLLIITI